VKAPGKAKCFTPNRGKHMNELTGSGGFELDGIMCEFTVNKYINAKAVRHA
jgi:hypothetical protein